MATVQGILADVNIRGHVDYLVALIESGTWESIWNELNVKYVSFAEVGLNPAANDAVVWQFCQDHQFVLLTSNRNQTGADSLESILRERTRPENLPVLTVSDPERFHTNRAYVDKVIESLLDILLDIDAYRGTQRLYLP
jgi:hypothetical protein